MQTERKRRPVRRNDPEGEVRRWNMHVLPGDPVIVTKDRGEQVHTTTRSQAWVQPSGQAVVLLEGISGSYLLSRCARASTGATDE